MFGTVSHLSLIAAGLYAFVAVSCAAAAATAVSRRQRHWHIYAWTALSALFCGLMISRIAGFEELARSMLREELRGGGAYEGRRDFQTRIVAMLLSVGAIGALIWFYRAGRALHGRRNMATIAALGAGAGMLLLIALRLISLHAIDKILFGPLKINWFADLGISVLIMTAGAFYFRHVRSRSV